MKIKDLIMWMRISTVYETIEQLDNRKYIPVLFSREFYTALGKDDMKEGTDLYLDIFIKMLEDANGNVRGIDEGYDAYLDLLDKQDKTRLLDILLKAKDKTKASVNRSLLFDQIAAKIIS